MLRLALTLAALAFASNVKAQVSAAAFGNYKLGGPSPVRPGDPTAYPHKRTPKAKFYVLVVAKDIPTMCTFEDCGAEAAVVEKMGGWITGDEQIETIGHAGLDQVEVNSGRQSLVVVANRTLRIVGIYPNHTTRDLHAILRAHGFVVPRKKWTRGQPH
jgi:hypothetical protein